MKAIIELPCAYSEGVLGEIEAQDKHGAGHWKHAEAPDAKSYYSSGLSAAPFQYEALRSLIPAGASILDVGVGLGQSSVFLASVGYKVTAMEPIPRFCQIITTLAERYGLDITVVRGVGESIASIGLSYDAVIFNSSLHHCDDPALAVRQAYASLKKGGQIFLVNENFLKPWRSEAKFQQLLITHPVGMGHYGGNEHSYHNWKYLRYLADVFGNADVLPPRTEPALDAIEHAVTIRIDGQRVHSSNKSVLSRMVFYMLRERLQAYPMAYKLLARASLLPATFLAIKR